MTQYCEYIKDLLSCFKDVKVKRMFGGFAVYVGGVIVGLVIDNQFYAKCVDSSAVVIESLNLERFCYLRGEKVIKLPYYKVEDEDLLVELVGFVVYF